jgi:hypothetical protein
MFGFAILAALLLPGIHAQPDNGEAILTRLVYGCADERAPVPAESDRDVMARLRSFDERCKAFQARTPPPRAGSDYGMAALARWSYERRLFAVGTGDAAAEAARYVAALRPCYEWEGFHDCPEREAVFAERYLKEHPASAFAAYLPLLAAHRWLCAAEAYEDEERSGVPASKQGVGHTRARLSFAQGLPAALASRDPLVRAAAETLKETGACLAPGRHRGLP